MFTEMREALAIPRTVDILDHVRALSNEPDMTMELHAMPSHNQEHSRSKPHFTTNVTQPPSSQLLSPSSATQPTPEPSSPQSRAVAAIQGIERRAMTSQRPQPGLQQLMAYLHRRGVCKALCTRNFPAPVHHLLDSFLRGEEFGTFEPIITRDSEGVQPKPSPEGIWRIAAHWGLDQDLTASSGRTPPGEHGDDFDPLETAQRHLGSGVIMVGDSIDDMVAGYRAGAATVLLANEENEHLIGHEYTGLSLRRLDELIDMLEKGFEEDT